MNTPLFDYDGAIKDLGDMYEHGRQTFAESVKPGSDTPAPFRLAVYNHTLEIGYAINEFFEFAVAKEAL